MSEEIKTPLEELQDKYNLLLSQFNENRESLVAMTKAKELLERELAHKALEASMYASKVKVLREALEKYADKNFWIRFPTYTLASADKGEMAKEALRMAYEGGSSNA